MCLHCPHPMLEMTSDIHEYSVTKPSAVNVTRMWLMTMPNSVTKPSAKNVTRMQLVKIKMRTWMMIGTNYLMTRLATMQVFSPGMRWLSLSHSFFLPGGREDDDYDDDYDYDLGL